jgi:NAD(P)-dependent dehydrogenase (short-subunit alcohol dehydrogenase family)
MQGLSDRVAIVTGGGIGIGKGIARRLAGEGMRLTISASSNLTGAGALRDELASQGTPVEIVAADLRDPDSARAIVDRTLDAYGQIDVLVNNAGFTLDEPFLEGATADWLDVFNINLVGMMVACQAAAPAMAERGFGRIVNISSVHSALHMPGHAIYAATKAGINGFTRNLAIELAPHGITCNVVAPGAIQVEKYEGLGMDPDALGAQIPLGRVGQVGDIAGAVAFLASDDASYVSGAVLFVDGALTARMPLEL